MALRQDMVLYFQSSLAEINMSELEGARRRAQDLGWHIQVIEYDGAAKNRFHTAGGGIADIRELLKFWRPDGCIVECGGRPPRFSIAEFGRTPVVLLDCHPIDVHGGVPCVYRDESVVGQCAARELLSLGFDDYAYLPWPESSLTWSRIRGEAYAVCVAQNGKRHHVFTHSTQDVDVVRIRRDVSNWIRTLPRPCGVFCANDIMAAIFIEAAAVESHIVTSEFAVVGVDNDGGICDNGAVSLTSIELDWRQCGAIAAALLAFHAAEGRCRIVPWRRRVQASPGVAQVAGRPCSRAVRRHS